MWAACLNSYSDSISYTAMAVNDGKVHVVVEFVAFLAVRHLLLSLRYNDRLPFACTVCISLFL